ncbi:hypothetical protein KA005_03000 [bacterium]|nr:hypothetical protein [bacterium]
MPYKDKEKQLEAQRQWAAANRDKVNKSRKAHSRKNVEMVRNLKEAGYCMDCDNSFPYPAMQYDHRPGTEKLGNVSTMVSSNVALEKVLAEIEKCDLVCANCHHIRTAKRKGYLL